MTISDPSLQVDDVCGSRRTLRIALVTETYPPEVNGVARTLARSVEGLRQRQHTVQLVRPRQRAVDEAEASELFHEVLMRGLPVPRYPELKMGLPAKRALVQLWSRQRPDVVHVATEGPLGWSAVQAARRLRLPVSSDFRTNFHAYSKHYGIGWLGKPIVAYLRRLHNQCDLTTVPTRELRDELQAYGFRGLDVLGRGVDTQAFDPAWRSEELRRSWGAGSDTPVMLHVGRLAPEKNLREVISAWQAVRARGISARLVWVGDGPARAAVQAQVPDAVFAGMLSGPALAAHYASGDVFVFPSLTETFGNVTTEALASALCVVAYRSAAAGQLIRDGIDGRLVDPGRDPTFAQAVADLLADTRPDAAWRAGSERRRAARQAALAIAWEPVLDRFESLLLDLARGGRGGALSVRGPIHEAV